MMAAIWDANQNDGDEADDGATCHDDGHPSGSSEDGHPSGSNGRVHCDDGLNVPSDAMNCDAIATPNPIFLDLIR